MITIAMLVVYLAWRPWFLSDYDFFHGELFVGALVFDHAFTLLVASDPYTTFSSFCYLAAWVAACAVLEPPLRSRGHDALAASP